MASFRFVLAAVLLGGCAIRPPIHSAPPTQTQQAEGLVVPADRVAQGRAAAEALDARMAKGECQALADVFRLAPDGGFLAKRQCEGLTGPIHTTLDPLFPLGDGLKADAEVNGVALGEVYLGPGEGNVWQIATEPPTTAANLVPPVLVAEKANLVFSPSTVVGDVLATVKDPQPVLEFEFDVQTPTGGHYRITEVSQDGARCPFRVVPGRLLIQPVRAGEELTLRIRFEGDPWDPADTVTPPLTLTSKGVKLPRLAHTWADFDVRARYPAGYTLFGEGQETNGTATPSEIQTHWTSQGSSFLLFGGTGYMVRHIQIDGVDVTLAVFGNCAPDSYHPLDRLAEAARVALDALKPLGPYPSPVLRIVLVPLRNRDNVGSMFQGAISCIAIGAYNLLGRLDTGLSVFLGQAWFGGRVPTRHDDLLPLVMGLYVSQWVDPDLALSLRGNASRSYAFAVKDPSKELPILSGDDAQEGSIGKALLMMVALEDKIGADHLIRELRLFLDQRAGQNSSWDDLAEVMRQDIGPDICDWLKNFVRTTGAPHVRMTDVRFECDFAWANLVVDEGDPRALVEVGFLRKGELVGEGKFALQKFSLVTPIRVPIPPGSEVLVMDPRFRIPRRYTPGADPVKVGFEFPLPKR